VQGTSISELGLGRALANRPSAVVAAVFGVVLLTAHAGAQETTRVSVDSAGIEGNAKSMEPRISWNGQFVAFFSFSRDLVPGDTNAYVDMFVHDRQNRTTTRVSVDSSGAQANHHSMEGGAISGDGRFVAFGSLASNLVPADINASEDVFVHDRQTGTTSPPCQRV